MRRKTGAKHLPTFQFLTLTQRFTLSNKALMGFVLRKMIHQNIKRTLLAASLLSCFATAMAQPDTATIYKNLERKKFYAVNTSSSTISGITAYQANGKSVDQATYDKYMSTWDNLKSCCPCILQSYNEKDILVKESVACGDCDVGWFKKFYPNGKLKLTGQYKENFTNNWDDIWDRGYCNVEEGEWIHYNENGEKMYSEFWKGGVFVKQIPEQSTPELWDVFIYLHGVKIDTQRISVNDIKNLQIIPKFKNSNRNLELVVKVYIGAVGYRKFEEEYTLGNFKDIDVNKILVDRGIPAETKTSFDLSISDKKSFNRSYFLNLAR